MPFPIAPSIVKERRLAMVAHLLSEYPRITAKEIWAYFAGEDRGGDPRLVNPETQEPYCQSTYAKDIAQLKEEYREKHHEERDKWIENLLMYYDSLYEKALEADDISEARQILKQIRDMIGLDKPAKVESTVSGEIKVDDGSEGIKDRLLADIQRILAEPDATEKTEVAE